MGDAAAGAIVIMAAAMEGGGEVPFEQPSSGLAAKLEQEVAGAAEGATKINNAAKAVEEFLGGEGKIIKNADGDAILMKGDKKIRFDVNDPHGDAPHFHLEQQTRSGKWKDAGPEHRYYFEK